MLQVGKMRLVKTVQGEVTPICIFETTAGDNFSIPRPQMSQEEESQVVTALREILKEEGLI